MSKKSNNAYAVTALVFRTRHESNFIKFILESPTLLAHLRENFEQIAHGHELMAEVDAALAMHEMDEIFL